MDGVTRFHQRTLVDAGVLVGAGVLGQRVDVDTGLARGRFVVVHPHLDARGIDGIHESAAPRHHGHTGVDGHRPFHARAHQRGFRTQGRHRLTLHVRTHEGAVRIVMFQERNQRGCDRHDLLWGDTSMKSILSGADDRSNSFCVRHEISSSVNSALLAQCAAFALRDHVLAFFDGRQIIDLIGQLAPSRHATVRRLQEAVIVGARIHGQRIDESDGSGLPAFLSGHTRP